MRTFGTMALALGMAAVIAAPAHAQGPRGRGGFFGGMFGGGGYQLLGNKSVQKELKLEDAQAEKLTKTLADINAKAFEKLQDIPQDERREKGAEVFRAANEEAKATAKSELKADQLTRLEQIIRQQQGLQAFAAPETAEKLQLTADQKSKVRELNQEIGEKAQELRSGSQEDRIEGMRKLQTLRKEALEKAVSSLSDDQKKTWKELTGEPFEVQFERRRGRNN